MYLSGAMRGVPDHNFPEFHRVANILRRDNHDVLNPADSTASMGSGRRRSEYLRHDIQLIMIVDALVLLRGWEQSPGARFEVAQAWMLEVPVYFFREHYKGYSLEPLDTTSLVIPREQQYLKGYPVVGLSGFAYAGKDEIAKTLVAEGFTRIAFADPLKALARVLGWNGEKDDEGRKFLQDLGVGVREILDSDAWVRAAEDSIERIGGPVVISDCRFPNEVAMVRRRKGQVIRVVRPGVGAVNGHISEHAIGDGDSDITFFNDCSLDELPEKVRQELVPQLRFQGAMV